MSLVRTIEQAVDLAIVSLGDSIISVNRARITPKPHIPGSRPASTAIFTRCSIAIVAMKVDDFPGTQIESSDKSILDIRPKMAATINDRYLIGEMFYRVVFAKNTFAGENLILQELVIRPSDSGGVIWP